jgi:hypothetical protein
MLTEQLPLALRLGRALLHAARDATAVPRARALFDEADSLDLLELDVLFEEATGDSLIETTADAPVTVALILDVLRGLDDVLLDTLDRHLREEVDA